MSQTITLTRKIQLQVDLPDKAEKDQVWQTLRHWQYACYRAANYIYTHHFLQLQIQDLIYLNEEVKVKLARTHTDPDGILTTSQGNTTYQVLSHHFKGEMPMSIMSQLNHMLVSTFNREREDYRKGEKSLRNYKRTIPIPIAPRELHGAQLTEDGRNIRFRLFHLPLRTYLGRDFSDKRLLLQKLVDGQLALKTSQVSIEGKKLYWLAAFTVEKDVHPLNEAILAEVSLSLDHPLIVTIGKMKFTIGTKDEFLYRRLAIQAARQRVQKQASCSRGGHGYKRKLKSTEAYREKERRYINYRLHVYSRRLMDLCVKYGAGTILLTAQQDKEEAAKEEPFVLRNWSYHGLKEKIEYKARKAGINVIVE